MRRIANTATIVADESVAGQISFSAGQTASEAGSVIQITSKATGVTLDAPSGQITTHTASLANLTTVAFNMTNSFVTSADIVTALHSYDGGAPGAYDVKCRGVGNGVATFSITNISGGSLAEAIVINFKVEKRLSA